MNSKMCGMYTGDKSTKDSNCNEDKKFLCQFDLCDDAGRKCPNSSAQSKPPDGYVFVSQTGKYYRPYQTRKKFLEALEVCQADGATLIEFRTPAEHEVLDHMQSE